MISAKDRELISFTKKVALKSVMPYRAGAVIIKGGRVIATGFNRASPASLKSDLYLPHSYIHAELDAILSVDKERVQGSIMAVFIYTKRSGRVAKSEPCACCKKLLKEYGVREVLFCESTGEIRRAKVNDWDLLSG